MFSGGQFEGTVSYLDGQSRSTYCYHLTRRIGPEYCPRLDFALRGPAAGYKLSLRQVSGYGLLVTFVWHAGAIGGSRFVRTRSYRPFTLP
jgi:hypothetical protein